MAFNIVVGITTTGAKDVDHLEQQLDDTSAAAGRTTEAVKTLGTETTKAAASLKDAGNAAASGIAAASSGLDSYRQKMDASWAAINKTVMEGGAVPRVFYSNLSDEAKAMIDSLERVVAPVQRYEQELAALAIVSKNGALSLEQYELALARTQKQAESSGAIAPMQGPTFDPARAGVAMGAVAGPAFDPNQAGRGMGEELRRQEELLRRLNAPMREYEQRLTDLDALLKRDAIDQETFNRELDKASKAAGKGLGPVLGPKQQTAGVEAAGGGGEAGGLLQAVAPQLGQGGQILSQFASGGVAAAAGAAALAYEIVHLGDEYTTLANKVERFTTETVSANDIIHQQLDLSKELHTSLQGAAELYDRTRESTYELNLSSRQQLGLAHDLGVEIAAEGKSAEDAAGLMRRLSLAFETGTIAGRELRGIMKQYPELASQLAAALGHSTSELIQLANKGQISGQQLIDAIHKIAPESEKAVGAMREGVGAWFGHMWDDLKVEVGGAVEWYRSQYDSYSEIAARNEVRSRRTREESARQLNAELEKNAKTAQIAGAAGGLGIAMPGFDKTAADNLTHVRMVMREAGADIADSFADAKAKAQMYGAEIDKIKEQHAAAEIAADAKRIYEALYGADDILKATLRQWTDIADKAKIAAEAAAKFRASQPVGPVDAQHAQMQRELDLAASNAKTDEDKSQYGKGIVSYAQGLNNAKAELDGWRRALKDGVIDEEKFRQESDKIATTLNDGRLPEAIKIWESIHLPIAQADRDLRALGSLFRSGRLDISEYTAELKKIADTGKNGNASVLQEGIARLNQEFEHGELTLRSYDEAVIKLAKDFDTLHKTSSGIQYRIAPQGPSGPAGLLPQTQQQLYLPSTTDSPDMKKIMGQYQQTGMYSEAIENAKQFNDQFERSWKLANEFVEPQVKYEQRLKDIAGAVSLNAITEDQAIAARRRAKDTLNQENEALEAQKGPMEAYAATLRKLKDQLDNHNISERKYIEGIDKAKETMFDATGAAKTFSGAMQINWIKMKEEADGFGAAVANLAVADVGKLSDAIVTAANGGQVSWSQMADAMVQDLERVALKMAEIGLIKGAIGLFSGMGGGAAGGGSEFATGATGGMFATGGSFLVGGDGGTDTTPIAFRATRGERVTITPPGAYPYPQAPASGVATMAGAGAAPVVHIHNHYDSSVTQAAIDGPGGQKSVINTLRINPGAARNMTSRPRRA